MNKIEEILKKINITIPNPPKPVGNYAAFSRYEKLIKIVDRSLPKYQVRKKFTVYLFYVNR